MMYRFVSPLKKLYSLLLLEGVADLYYKHEKNVTSTRHYHFSLVLISSSLQLIREQPSCKFKHETLA